MTAVRMWARAEIRARWKSFVVLGLLAGITFGIAAAAVAGARRSQTAVDRLQDAAHLPSAAILANDESFDESQRAQVAALPYVRHTYPFLVAFLTQVFSPKGLEVTILPETSATANGLSSPLVEGRLTDPTRAEATVSEAARDRFDLHVGSTLVIGQSKDGIGPVSPDVDPTTLTFRQRLRVVGISKSTTSEPDWTPSSLLYEKYAEKMPGFTNLFVDLRGGEADVTRLRADVEKITGHPVNTESTAELFGIRKARSVTDVESDGLLLFAVAALLGGGVLVGQALVRAVSAGAADLPTWRAIGADRKIAVRALVAPTAITAATGAVTMVIVAIAISSRFPIGVARRYELHIGTHADWVVLVAALVGIVLAVGAIAGAAAWWRVTRRDVESARPSTAAAWAARMGWSPALVIGSRLAVEPGRGRRAVPVRSALIGATVGVIGVVGCLTFRAGIDDARTVPERSGVVWDFALAAGEASVPPDVVDRVAGDDRVAAVLDAAWHRAVPVNGSSIPVFGTTSVKGDIPLVVIGGRRPDAADEIALAPTTMKELGVSLGERVRVGQGPAAVSATIVGKALLPATSHTDYDQSGWMTGTGLNRVIGEQDPSVEDYLLIRWKPGVDRRAAQHTLIDIGGPDLYAQVAAIPTAITDLGRLEDLPLVLGVFFGLLACATVAHALVTTARRRRHDFAVLRTIGFTRRQSRVAVAWQATLLVTMGIVVGVPLGIAAGRFAWRWLADGFPVAYEPPIALLAILLIAPIAILIANALAAGPARSVARIRPAEALRTE